MRLPEQARWRRPAAINLLIVAGLALTACAGPRRGTGELMLVDRIPHVVGERGYELAAAPAVSGAVDADVQLSAAEDAFRIDYEIRGPGAWFTLNYPLPNRADWDEPAERLQFWLNADGSGDQLEVHAYHEPTQRWIAQAELTLDFEGWRHLEIPAANPLHLYHPTITAFRFLVRRRMSAEPPSGRHRLLMRGLRLVAPQLVAQRYARHRVPAPIFSTWGEPGAQEIERAPLIGLNLHLVPIDFPNGQPLDASLSYAIAALGQIEDAGMVPGISFTGQPGDAWVTQHEHLLPRKSDGLAYTRPGAAFPSPWAPQVQILWGQHISAVLRRLEKQNRLDEVQVVELAPGEEGGLAFQWDHVWSFGPHAVEAYRQYLRILYADDIARLNADWPAEYQSFDEIKPPADYVPDREHWVFTDFYRLSMLRYAVAMADAVHTQLDPPYWSWRAPAVENYPRRMNGARFPIFYALNLRRLGILDYVQVPAEQWQSAEDIALLQSVGIRVIGQLDTVPSEESLRTLFEQVERLDMDGAFIGVLDQHVETGHLTAIGETCQRLIEKYFEPPPPMILFGPR